MGAASSGWRSHTQQIAIGLSTASLTVLAIQRIWESIITTAKANPAVLASIAEQQRVVNLGPKLSNANSTIYIAILIWWIVCLWRDEPGTSRVPEAGQESVPDTEQADAVQSVSTESEAAGRKASN